MKTHRNYRASRGFTLIELMIVIAIMALLTMIAYPSYVEMIRKGRRAEAKELAMSIAQAQERFYSANARYALTLNALGITHTTSENGYYQAQDQISADGASYQIKIDTKDDQQHDLCGNYSLDSAGVRTVSGSLAVRDCW
jgi:type IV pilus assembly protein PilE